ncbi:cysteine desulfurase family protein [Cohnella boryungensis]|uniref:cysteine desulfurase n=1 Tax=Cohnella boryungensis TaxID=768479 RepID=A0ABV8SG09_9BACL
MIYLDYAATTPIDPQVYEDMKSYLLQQYGNPNGKYYTQAIETKNAVDNARERVAKFLKCQMDELIITSGASEANNFIIKGIVDASEQTNPHIVTTQIEHSSILATCKFLEKRGCKVTYLSVDDNGQIELDDLRNALTEETTLVSIGWGNNEIGTLVDIQAIGNLIKNVSSQIFFHTDATQAVGKVPINFSKVNVDALSFSAHKFYGPKGVGGAVIKRDKDGILPKITPLIHGGEQEMGLRGGTSAVANIVGMGKAAEIADKDLSVTIKHIEKLYRFLIEELQKSSISFKVNNFGSDRLFGIVSLTLYGVSNELIIKALASDVAVSAGSACSATKPSHVLSAIGLNKDEIRSTIRVSFGKYTEVNDIRNSVKAIEKVYEKFRVIKS